MIKELMERASEHDSSKLESPELEVIAAAPDLSKLAYGTPEYEASLENIRPALEHHYSKNRHHPEFWVNGVNGMDLVDLIELLCDWEASSQRNKNGNINKSIEINGKKYNISPQLVEILNNTVDRYFT